MCRHEVEFLLVLVSKQDFSLKDEGILNYEHVYVSYRLSKLAFHFNGTNGFIFTDLLLIYAIF